MVWNNIPFVTNEVCREILCLMAEYSWEFVPAAVTTMVQAIFSSWGTSLMNELGFRHIRGRAKACENGQISPATSWKTLAESSPFKAFGRRHATTSCC